MSGGVDLRTSDEGVASEITVNGTAEAVEVAAVVAALSRHRPQLDGPEESPYGRWRRGRIEALRAAASAG